MKNANARPVDFERRSNSGPRQTLRAPKPKRWSHQDDLDALVGKRIGIITTGEGHEIGRLVAADQFALKLAIEGQSSLTSPTIVFKHAIRCFAELPELSKGA